MSNIYYRLKNALQRAKLSGDLYLEDHYANASIRIAQINIDEYSKEDLINLIQRYDNSYKALQLQNQALTTELINNQNQGYGSGSGPQLKPSQNIAGGTDIFFEANDIARTVVQDGSHMHMSVEHNENIPLLINV
jgi:hypothetical protein